MSTTAAVIISDALAEIGVLGEGETATGEMIERGLRMLNRMLDTLSTKTDWAYFASMEQKALTGQQSFTIGPTGDVITNRPIKIETAVVDRNGITYPVKVIDNERYDPITYKALALTVLADRYSPTCCCSVGTGLAPATRAPPKA